MTDVSVTGVYSHGGGKARQRYVTIKNFKGSTEGTLLHLPSIIKNFAKPGHHLKFKWHFARLLCCANGSR